MVIRRKFLLTLYNYNYGNKVWTSHVIIIYFMVPFRLVKILAFSYFSIQTLYESILNRAITSELNFMARNGHNFLSRRIYSLNSKRVISDYIFVKMHHKWKIKENT